MRKEVDTFQYVVETNKLMRKEGILLVAEGKDQKPNTMTIGSAGELSPKIITKDKKRERFNRRVTVKIEELGDDFSPVPLPLDADDF